MGIAQNLFLQPYCPTFLDLSFSFLFYTFCRIMPVLPLQSFYNRFFGLGWAVYCPRFKRRLKGFILLPCIYGMDADTQKPRPHLSPRPDAYTVASRRNTRRNDIPRHWDCRICTQSWNMTNALLRGCCGRLYRSCRDDNRKERRQLKTV